MSVHGCLENMDFNPGFPAHVCTVGLQSEQNSLASLTHLLKKWEGFGKLYLEAISIEMRLNDIM